MARGLPVPAVVLLLVPPALAQEDPSIQWSLKVEESVAQAQQTSRPLMFWVLGRADSRDHRLERDQKRAFRDRLVVELSRRFITVRLSRSRYRDLLENWSVPPSTNLEIVFVTPAGEKIDTLAPAGVAEGDTLARKMALVFQHHRRGMFEREIKPKLEDEKASDQEFRRALKLVTEFLILSADQAVIKLLERPSLSRSVRNDAYDALAALSTPASVQTLLKRAGDDEGAGEVLGRCTPDAAERMLPALEGGDAGLRLLVYHAVTRICKIRDVKDDRFWQGRNLVVKRKEIERVRRLVGATARRWRERYAEYR